MKPILTTLSQSPTAEVVALAEVILPQFSAVEVLANRTGIAMLPYRDSAQGVVFHLGEVLMSEARVRVTSPSGTVVEGYGACLGRDTQHALAMAVLDAALRGDVAAERIEAFVAQHAAALEERDRSLWAQVETTRVAMETF